MFFKNGNNKTAKERNRAQPSKQLQMILTRQGIMGQAIKDSAQNLEKFTLPSPLSEKKYPHWLNPLVLTDTP